MIHQIARKCFASAQAIWLGVKGTFRVRKHSRIAWVKLSDRQRLIFLSISGVDLEHARQAVSLSQMAFADTEVVRRKLYEALADVAVVRYARPFGLNNVLRTVSASLPNRYLKGFTPRQKNLHEYFLRLRNRVAAHSDHDARDVIIQRVPHAEEHFVAIVSHSIAHPGELNEMLGMIQMINANMLVDQTALTKIVGEDKTSGEAIAPGDR